MVFYADQPQQICVSHPWVFQEDGFADDLALIGRHANKIENLYTNIAQHLVSWGLILSRSKTEALVTLLRHEGHFSPPGESGDQIKFCSEFRYLGSHIDWELTCDADILYRLDQARKAFWRLNASVWGVKQLTLRTKISVYRACVLSVLLYGAETWTVGWQMKKKLKVFHMMCMRRISGIPRWLQQRDSVTNQAIFRVPRSTYH